MMRDELYQRIVTNSPDATHCLMEHRGLLNDTSSTRYPPLLHTAAAWGQDELIECMLGAGADVDLICPHDVDGCYQATALDVAQLHQHSSTTRLLMARGARVDFFSLVAQNDLQRLRESIQADASLLRSERFSPGCRPLHFAATVGSNAMIDLLCDMGADVNEVDARGRAPLWYACLYFRSVLVLQTLYAHGAEINRVAADGSTPLLMVSSHYETLPAARWLVQHAADPNLVTSDRNSPLLSAVTHRVKETVELLVQHGADLTFCGADGLTALELAESRNYSEMLQLLPIALS